LILDTLSGILAALCFLFVVSLEPSEVKAIGMEKSCPFKYFSNIKSETSPNFIGFVAVSNTTSYSIYGAPSGGQQQRANFSNRDTEAVRKIFNFRLH
jgi:hypothetical protein